MMPAAKHFDPVLGIDVHIIITPVGVPVPVPHPFIGFLMDPFDYLPIVGSTILINGLHRAIAGTMGRCVPSHIPIGGTFAKPPANECEMFMGSMTVEFDGDVMSYASLPALSCQDIGMPAPPRANPKKKSKVKSLVLPTSMVLPIPAGPPVLIGGPPIISLTGLLTKAAMSGIGKGLKRLGKTKAVRKIRAKVARKLKHSKCKVLSKLGFEGHPVDVIGGASFDTFDDFEWPGPTPFRWVRHYTSARTESGGPLGPGFRHLYQRELFRTPEGIVYRDEEGQEVGFDDLGPGRGATINDGIRLRRLESGVYEIAESRGPRMLFLADRATGVARLAQIHDRGVTLKIDYDPEGRLSRLHDTLGREALVAHDGDGRIVEVRFRAELDGPYRPVVRYEYDRNGRMVCWRDAEDHAGRYAWDDAHRATALTDRNGYTFSYEYDELGRCVRTRGDGGLYDVRLEYRPEALATVATHADGARFTYGYDELGNLLEIHDARGVVSTFVVDPPTGRVLEQVDANGVATRFEYDAWGAHVRTIHPLGYVLPPVDEQPILPDPLSYELPATPLEWEFGRLLPPGCIDARRTPSGAAKAPTERHDQLGRLVERVDALGRAEAWSHDAEGNVVAHRDRDGRVYRTEYGLWNTVAREIDPLGRVTEYATNARQQVVAIRDARGVAMEFPRDHRDSIAGFRQNGVTQEAYLDDDAGNLRRKAGPDGRNLLTCDLGPKGLPVRYTAADGSTLNFAYDGAGRIRHAAAGGIAIQLDYDLEGRLVADLRDGRGVQHEFRGARLRKSTYLGAFEVRYRADAEGSAVVRDPTGCEHSIRVGRDGRVRRVHANGTVEVADYDPDGRCRVKETAHRSSPGRAWVRRYRYSGEGDLIGVEDSRSGRSSFVYDAAHRLEAETRPDGSRRVYRFDASDNLLEQAGLSGVHVDGANRLVAASGGRFTYNGRDAIVEWRGSSSAATFAYDGFDRLSGCVVDGLAWSAEYDPMGRRVRKSWAGRSIEHYWDDFRLAAEVASDGGVRLYIYPDPTSMVPLLVVDYDGLDAPAESGEVYVVLCNHLGVPIRLEDGRGEPAWEADVDPFAGCIARPGGTLEFPLRFPGHYHDAETGLYYNRNRYYSPALGRYLSQDPIGAGANLNLYGYVTNPLRDVDLDGLGKDCSKVAETKNAKRRASAGAKKGPDVAKPKADFPAPKDDPARKALGPARLSHPDEIAAMRREMKAEGVEIVERPGTMAYSPGSRAGQPGQLIIDPDASFSAWKHEFRHFSDDRASGWNGMSALTDKKTRWDWEKAAYAEEQSIARKLGRQDIVDDLDALKTEEWRKIFMPHLGSKS